MEWPIVVSSAFTGKSFKNPENEAYTKQIRAQKKRENGRERGERDREKRSP